MTRLEELTSSLADNALSDEEGRELETLLGESEQARQAYLRILQIEAGLRVSRRNLDLSTPIMARLRTDMAESFARNVMSEIKTQPTPDRRRQSGFRRRFEKLAAKVQPLSFPLGHGKLSMKPVLFAFAACLAVMIGVWFFGPAMGQPALAEVHGEGLSILRAGQPLPISTGMLLRTGDILRTSADVTVVVGFSPEATRLTLLPDTEVKLAEMSRGKHFELRAGKLEASVARQRPFRPMTLITPQAEARVIGTRFSLLASNNATRLDVFEGNVRLTRLADAMAVQVGKGRYAVVAEKTELSALPFTGTLLRQWWSGVPGHSVLDFRNDPRYPNHPDGSELARAMELPSIMTNQLGVRFCGYLHPPVTGEYEFWLSGATSAKLFMSPTENPADEVTVAFVLEPSRNMDRPRYQTSPSAWAPPVPLVAGRRYYIEALVFVDKGEGFLSIAWKRDGQSREPLAAEFLSPYTPQ